MGTVVPFRPFKFNLERQKDDVTLLWCAEDEAHIEFKHNEKETTVDGKVYRQTGPYSCKFWGTSHNDPR